MTDYLSFSNLPKTNIVIDIVLIRFPVRIWYLIMIHLSGNIEDR